MALFEPGGSVKWMQSSWYMYFVVFVLCLSISGATAECNCTSDCVVDCPSGQYSNSSGDCLQCPPGFYCDGGTQAPLPCGSGTFNSDPGGSDLIDCSACPSDGYFSLAGAETCTLCPAGSKCNSSTGTMTACSDGQYSLAGDMTCLECPDGLYCPSVYNEPMICPSGHVPFSNQTGCEECGAGTYAYNGTVSCQQCPPGYKCPTAGLDGPIQCATGYYANETASQSCEQCPEGYRCTSSHLSPVICPRGSYALAGSTSCTSCGDSEYADSTGLSSCMACPEGYSCNSTMASPQICAPGTYSPEASKYCLECPDGSYMDLPGQASCAACPAGSACLDKTSGRLVGWLVAW
eukprot:XP_011665423.1 PREDICTED: signal peptide, CUB and EGF-like domain-containing protein 1 [Strongylocentrotus purpuratus]